MKRLALLFLVTLFTFSSGFSQEEKEPRKPVKGHTDQNKFRQLKDVLATPNEQRTASGAPGYKYTQQKVDYIMDIRLDENKSRITGNEKITYHNNSKDYLEYLWLQLDQNMRAEDSKTPDINTESFNANFNGPITFTRTNLKKKLDRGFDILSVKKGNGSDQSYTINQTMMRINLDKPLAPGEVFNFEIDWAYNVNNHIQEGGRSGYEAFPDGNNTYVIAQFFPDAKCFGYLLAGEIKAIDTVMETGQKPVTAILGGAKVSSKITIIENILEKIEKHASGCWGRPWGNPSNVARVADEEERSRASNQPSPHRSESL